MRRGRLLSILCVFWLLAHVGDVIAQEAFEMKALPSERAVVAQGGYIPKMVVLKNGEILATFKTGGSHVHKASRASMSRSKDNGNTWSQPEIIFDIPDAEDSTDFMGQLADGTVLFAAVSHTWSGVRFNQNEGWKAETYVIRSKDNGNTWDKPIKVNTSPYDWSYPYGRLVELEDGTLLMTCFGGYFPVVQTQTSFGGSFANKPPEKQGDFSFLVRSRDGGKTWGEPSVIAQRHNETTMIKLPSGKLIAAARREREFGEGTDIVFSSDKGFTWTKPVPTLNSQEHPADLLLLRNGSLLMTFGVRHKPYGVQATLSLDQGRTWKEDSRFLLAWDGDHADLGYPFSVERSDGKILTLYYIVYKEIDVHGEKGIAPLNAFTKSVIWQIPKVSR